MTIRVKIAVFLVATTAFCGCRGGDTAVGSVGEAQTIVVDQTDPVQVVAAIFEVAGGRSGATLLGTLCDPQHENDADTRRICDFAGGFDPGGEFPMFFREGKVMGKARVSGNAAAVPFVYGPRGDKLDTMFLVMRNEKWYLSRF